MSLMMVGDAFVSARGRAPPAASLSHHQAHALRAQMSRQPALRADRRDFATTNPDHHPRGGRCPPCPLPPETPTARAHYAGSAPWGERSPPSGSVFCGGSCRPHPPLTPTGAPPSLGALRGESGRPLRGRVSFGYRQARLPRREPLDHSTPPPPTSLNRRAAITPTGARTSLRALRGESGRPLRGRYLFRLPPAPASSRGGNIRSRGASSPPRPTGPKNYHAAASAGAL